MFDSLKKGKCYLGIVKKTKMLKDEKINYSRRNKDSLQ